MEFVYFFTFTIICIIICLFILAYLTHLEEQKAEWLKKFEQNGKVISVKYGQGVVFCIKPSIYSAYVEFESFTGWINLDDLVPISRNKNKY